MARQPKTALYMYVLMALVIFVTLGQTRVALAGSSASVLMYHRFGDNRYPSTNITLEQFEAHIRELQSGKYTVLSIPEILARQQRGEELPDRTVGISIDDAYLSAYTEAWPRLRDAGIPFTLFVSSGSIDNGQEDFMNWDQLREMARSGVTIGGHTETHLHMPDYNAQRLNREISYSNKRYREELGEVPAIFAYPYGEASLEVIAIVQQAGYTAAFGQHSGAFNNADGRYFLPRFPLSESFGSLDRFKMAAGAMALPVTDITPEDMTILSTAATPATPAIGFTLRESLPGLNTLSCFLSHEGKAQVMRLGETRFEVRVRIPFPPGRTRLNCTLPGSGENADRWHWFGQQYYVPEN